MYPVENAVALDGYHCVMGIIGIVPHAEAVRYKIILSSYRDKKKDEELTLTDADDWVYVLEDNDQMLGLVIDESTIFPNLQQSLKEGMMVLCHGNIHQANRAMNVKLIELPPVPLSHMSQTNEEEILRNYDKELISNEQNVNYQKLATSLRESNCEPYLLIFNDLNLENNDSLSNFQKSLRKYSRILSIQDEHDLWDSSCMGQQIPPTAVILSGPYFNIQSERKPYSERFNVRPK